MSEELTKILEAKNFLEGHISKDFLFKDTKKIAIVLGSGFSELADILGDVEEYSYNEIPNFPVSTVKGHSGKLIVGNFEDKVVFMLQGRVHYYEGYSEYEIVRAVRTLGLLGVEDFVITNAAGGINVSFKEGDLMLIEDHINLMGINPLRGRNIDEFGDRFPDMTDAYDKDLKRIMIDSALSIEVPLKRGVYVALQGPSYETPAEIRFLRVIGADAVGMSTVPEVIALNHMKKRVTGLSLITNMAAGVLLKPLTHEEVFETFKKAKTKIFKLIEEFLRRL